MHALAIAKLLVLILALLGFYLPGGYLYRCNPGHTPRSAPSNCERIAIKPPRLTL